jgi:hypothetical protein
MRTFWKSDDRSPLSLSLAVVRRLVDEHGAQVLEYDVGEDGGCITLDVPVTVSLRLRVLRERVNESKTAAERLLLEALDVRARITAELDRSQELRQAAARTRAIRRAIALQRETTPA